MSSAICLSDPVCSLHGGEAYAYIPRHHSNYCAISAYNSYISAVRPLTELQVETFRNGQPWDGLDRTEFPEILCNENNVGFSDLCLFCQLFLWLSANELFITAIDVVLRHKPLLLISSTFLVTCDFSSR